MPSGERFTLYSNELIAFKISSGEIKGISNERDGIVGAGSGEDMGGVWARSKKREKASALSWSLSKTVPSESVRPHIDKWGLRRRCLHNE